MRLKYKTENGTELVSVSYYIHTLKISKF